MEDLYFVQNVQSKDGNTYLYEGNVTFDENGMISSCKKYTYTENGMPNVYEGNLTFENGRLGSCKKYTYTENGITMEFEGNVTFDKNGRLTSCKQVTIKKDEKTISVPGDTYIRNKQDIIDLVRKI